MITIDISKFYDETAKLSQLPDYVAQAKEKAGSGNVITLTGPAPVWMYLKLAHALHGKAVTLYYDSPASGSVLIFNHDPKG